MTIIGIGGGTASGKTTLARLFCQAIGPRAHLIPHDHYYKNLPDAFRGREVEYNFDHPDALDNARLAADLQSLAAGGTAEIPNYDFIECRRTDPSTWSSLTVAEGDVVVVEGILVLAVPELREQFDRCFFVHSPADIRLVRRLRRDLAERGDTVHGVLDQWMATVRPMHDAFVEPSRRYAEHVFDGIADTDSLVQGLLQRLDLQIGRASGRATP